MRLFCAPYIGGRALMYRNWPDGLPDDIEVCAIELPGHGRRMKEAPYTSLNLLVSDLADSILTYLDRPFAFFGHSFGALVCFEMVRELRSRSSQLPFHLCVSGAKAPQLLDDGAAIHRMADPKLIDQVRSLGGTQAGVLDDGELVAALLPSLRADFQALETYQYTETAPFDFPILALGAVADSQVDRASLQAWAQHTTVGFTLEMFPGNHFFIHQAEKSMLQIIAAALKRPSNDVK